MLENFECCDFTFFEENEEMDPHLMIFDRKWHDDDIIRMIETKYPDPLERKEYINRWFESGGNWCTLLTESIKRVYRRTLVTYLIRNGADSNVYTRLCLHSLDFWTFENANENVQRTSLLLAYGANPNMHIGNASVLMGHILGYRVNVTTVLLTHGAQLKSGEFEILMKNKATHIISNFYQFISLRRISLHYIRLEQIRSQ